MQRAEICYAVACVVATFTQVHLSALNENSEIHFKRSDVIKIRDGIIFNFYTGLPHNTRVNLKALGLADQNQILMGQLYNLIQIRSNFGRPL